MKKSYIIIAISLSINIVLIFLLISMNNRLNIVEEFTDRDRKDEVATYRELEENLSKQVTDLMNKIKYIENYYSSIDEVVQNVSDLKSNFPRLENLLFNLSDINIISGVAKNIEIKDDSVSLNVRLNDILYGEDAVKTLMDKGYTRQDAEDKGHYVSHTNKEMRTFEVSKDCQVYCISEIGLVECSVDDYIEKTTREIKENFEDDSTFVLIDGKVIQIYQAYIPDK
ncbi:hypothetical protein SH1V18_44330 [Vallitalea longa]|uniref:Uncharacterized protein n=1 Tax=Vallitalea longa TaxID=2936439 RepID=A0A9W6DHY8_9FIRM|nr:hypothetical protein [Vallitalea longa]GKX31953.1 hypothetical protein SH1V18_44330 [Vallitalea longa]